MENLSKSTNYFEKAIKYLVNNHPNSNELADMYQTASDVLIKHNILDCSAAYCTNAYEIRKTMLESSDIYEGDYNNSMGVLYLKKNEYDKAMSYFHKALKNRRKYFGENHEKIADTLVNMGQTYKHFLLYEEALSCCDEAISIYTAELGLRHKKIANLLYNIA